MTEISRPRIVRVVTPDGDRHCVAPIIENLLNRGLIFKDNHGVVNAESGVEFDKLVAEHGMCDFCSTPEATHMLVVPDFQMDLMDGTKVGNSTGGWAACDPCYDLVKTDKRQELLDRSIEGFGKDKYSVAAIRHLHGQFWKKYEELADAAGAAAAAKDFIEDKLPKGLKNTILGRDARIATIQRLTGMDADETKALIRGELAYKQVASKISAWAKRVGKNPDDARLLAELSNAAQNRPTPYGYIPHWQQALDSKFTIIDTLQQAVNANGQFLMHFPEAIDLNDLKAVREMTRKTQAAQEFQSMGYLDDIRHLRLAEVYSFNEDTMEAIRLGAQTIPHESPLSSVTTPNIAAGWFYFAKPFPVVSSPLVSDVTQALLWGWEEIKTLEGKPVLRMTTFVRDQEGKLSPSTKWTWPLNLTFHEMIGLNTLAHRKMYGPGAPYEHMPNLVGEKETMQCIAEMSLFFMMACVWFKQRVVIGVKGHVERHARKRYQREHKLAKPPEVQVIALRASEKSGESHVGGGDGERKYNKWHWVVSGHNRLQACGPERKDRKLIWIDPFVKGNKDLPLKPKPQKVFAVIR